MRRDPFTIRLRFATRAHAQSARVGVDTGSKEVGLAAIANGEVAFQAEVHLRDDISEKMTQRREFRRNRRARKTRYRQARFDNRRRPAGWLPPSLHSKAEATVKAVRFIASILPVGQVTVEVGRFDTQRMQHPAIAHLEYQQGELQGYLLHEYALAKWQRKCAYCGAREVPLELEHIVPRSRGGSNRASNLTLACHACNQRKGQQTAAEFGFPDVQAQARTPLRDAAHVSSLKSRVVHDLQAIFGASQVRLTYGYETKYKRLQVLDLPKSHTNDSVAIACEIGEVVRPLEVVHHLRCLGRGHYQRFNGLHSEHKCWAPRKVRGFKLYELVKAKGRVGYIAGRREQGAFVIKDVISGKKLVEVTPRKLVRVARPTQGWMITRQTVLEGSRKEGALPHPFETWGTSATVIMDSILKRKENGVPHFTEDNLQRIIINPFYAITVAPQLTEEHEPAMGEAEWVQANASLMREMGSARWLRQLLDVLESKAGAPEGPISPSRAVNIDPLFAAAHPPLIEREMWVDVNVTQIRNMGAEGWLRQLLDVLERRHRDGWGGRLCAARRALRVRCARQI